MLIKVKDNGGNVYSNDTSQDKTILEIHFSTSYTQFVVQDVVIDDEGNTKYPKKDIIVPTTKDDLESAIDFMAVSNDELGCFA